MENQLPTSQPIPPVLPPPLVQPPITQPKPGFPFKILLIIIIVAVISVIATIIFLKGSSSTPTNVPQPSPLLEISPTITQSIPNNPSITPEISEMIPNSSPTNSPLCDVSDNTFCPVIASIKTIVSTKNFSGLIGYQNIQTTSCDPDGMFVAVCEGVAKGVVKQGYSIGYNQSEGTLVTKDDYIKTVSAYDNSNGPFIYRGSLVSGNKGIIVFLNNAKDHLLVFPMNKAGTDWKADHVLLGGTFGDTAYEELSPALLNP